MEDWNPYSVCKHRYGALARFGEAVNALLLEPGRGEHDKLSSIKTEHADLLRWLAVMAARAETGREPA